MDCYVDSYLPQSPVFQILMYDRDRKNKPVGWAIIALEGPKEARLLAILIQDPYRRQGYGKELIRLMQEKYDTIRTQYAQNWLNTPGIQLCIKSGFLPKVADKRGVGDLVWKKAKDPCNSSLPSRKG